MAEKAKKKSPAQGRSSSDSLKRIQNANQPESAAEKKAACTDLKKELTRLTKDMPYEDLRFLVAQSLVLIRNREAESLEREFAESYEVASRSAQTTGEKGTKKGKASAPAKAVPPIQIIRSSSGNANLVINGQFKLLTPEELAAIAKISLGGGSEAELLERLYRWLYRERRDIIIDAGMSGPASPTLRQLLSFCLKTFSKRKAKD
jgi:hypothetical protein